MISLVITGEWDSMLWAFMIVDSVVISFSTDNEAVSLNGDASFKKGFILLLGTPGLLEITEVGLLEIKTSLFSFSSCLLDELKLSAIDSDFSSALSNSIRSM